MSLRAACLLFSRRRWPLKRGRIMLKRLGELAHERMDFAFETTLASKTFAPWIAKLRDSGYRFQLLYLWLPNSELAVKRVLDRVRQGEVSMGQRCRKIATHLRSGGKG